MKINAQPSTSGAQSTPDADRAEVKRLAQEFEALLLTQMMREMRRSMLDDERGDGLGADVMVDTGDIAFGSALSRNGGLGLSGQLLDVFERQIAALEHRGDAAVAPSGGSVTAATSVPEARTAPGIAEPALVDVAQGAEGRAQSAPISSRFGWRRDPLTGTARFHTGVDIAIAYGHDVRSAADGVVSFAGTQGGYGQTVVIDHGNGRQTRYAHLSEPLVKAGDTVAEGQVVGKSGRSGRSTGPHLHFEMLVDGKAVDPLNGRS